MDSESSAGFSANDLEHPEAFIGKLLHDLKGNQSVIQGAAEILLTEPKVASIELQLSGGGTITAREILEGIVRAANIMGETIHLAYGYADARQHRHDHREK